MNRCSYSWEEWDGEKHESVKKRCQEMNWEGSDEFCIFHDSSPEAFTGAFFIALFVLVFGRKMMR